MATLLIYPFVPQPLKTSKTLYITSRLLPQSIVCTSYSSVIFRPRMQQSQSQSNKPPTSRKNPRKKKYASSRRSILKKTYTQEQVVFEAPVSDAPVVGIIGGGMAGLVCALCLERRGVRSTVFDTGLHGLGGRMGTRIIEPEKIIFDHAAQFFTVSDPRFMDLVGVWIEKGLVREWQGTVGELEAGGHFVPLPSSSPLYFGVNGMRPLADAILSETNMVKVVRPCWISALEPYNGMWHLTENGKPCGQFDAIVIAHNGDTSLTYVV